MGTKQGQLRSSGTANQGASSQVFRRIHYLCITTEHAYMRAPGGGRIAGYSVKRKLNMFSNQSCDVRLAKLYSADVANISRKHTPHAIHPECSLQLGWSVAMRQVPRSQSRSQKSPNPSFPGLGFRSYKMEGYFSSGLAAEPGEDMSRAA